MFYIEGVEAVSGVFLLLGLGMFLGILILIFEHLFYKYSLPILRRKPRDSIWKSRNIMFFSQVNHCVNCFDSNKFDKVSELFVSVCLC